MFTTAGPPRISTEPAGAIGHETATLKAKINLGELATIYHFEYGETTGYGSETPAGGGSIPAAEAPAAVSAMLTGLKLGVTYHYRLIATTKRGARLDRTRRSRPSRRRRSTASRSPK